MCLSSGSVFFFSHSRYKIISIAILFVKQMMFMLEPKTALCILSFQLIIYREYFHVITLETAQFNHSVAYIRRVTV